MLIDTDHLHHWIQAIRQSPDPMRTMDAFWAGQIKSKEWLIDNIEIYLGFETTIDIHGGWVGVLASMLFQTYPYLGVIRSIDIDPECENIATTMNKLEEMKKRFIAISSDMCNVESTADIIINTSCEHITQQQYDLWLNKLPQESLIVLQSNNFNIPEHIRIAENIEKFKLQSKLSKVLYQGELDLPKYKRFMLIGYR